MKFSKATPFLIVFGIVEIILFFITINYLFIDNKGGMALAGTLALIAFVVILGILLLEQVIVNFAKINLKLLWFCEIILLIIMAIYILKNGISIG